MSEDWVFGLSLDQEVEWSIKGAREIDGEWTLSGARNRRFEGKIPVAEVNKHRSDIGAYLKTYLYKDIEARVPSDVIASVSAIGVSAVGIVDRRNLRLVRAALTTWGEPKEEPLVDFKDLFDGLFPQAPVQGLEAGTAPRINIYNETTAKCLAERARLGTTVKEDFGLLYVLFSEGVNAGFVLNNKPIVAQINTELGHIRPRPHKHDLAFDVSQSGCRYHKFCFEGLAGHRRIRQTWGKGKDVHLYNLPPYPAQDVISFYIAQMCMNGVLCFSPSRVLLGGKTIFPGIEFHVREHFREMNKGFLDMPYVTYPGMIDDHGKENKTFIDLASIPLKEAGIEGALEAARRLLANPDESRDAAPSAEIHHFPRPENR